MSAYGDSSDNLIIMLAKQITGRMRGADVSADDIREKFRKARETEQTGEKELIDPITIWPDQVVDIIPSEKWEILKTALPDVDHVKNGNGKHIQDVMIPDLEPLPSGQMRLF